MAAEPPEGVARFVIWYGARSNDEAGERDALLGRLGITRLSDVHGKLGSDFQPELSDELSFFLEYTGQGKLCTAFQRIPRIDQISSGGILDERVIALRPSVRAANCLEFAGIETVAELVRWTPEELIELPSMGRKTVSELISLLAAVGINSPSSTEPFATGQVAHSGTRIILNDNEMVLDTLLTLSQAGASEKLAARLEFYGIVTLADLARREAGRFWIDTKSSPEDLCSLASCLRRRGLRWGMTIPAWQLKHTIELTEAFGHDLVLSSRNTEISTSACKSPASLQGIADSLNDEIEMLFPNRADDRDRMIVKTYWGLDGGSPQTLEETAQRYSLTRERIRQIGKPFYRALAEFGQRLPWLEETVSVLNKLAPCFAESAERALESQGILKLTIRCESLLNLAREAGIAHSLVVEGSSRLLLTADLVDKLKQSASYAAKMVAHWGVARREEVLPAISFSDSSRSGIMILSGISRMVWLDAEQSFFWMPTGKSAVENRLVSILHVAPDVPLDVAYEGVLRDGRVSRERLPFPVFSRLCEQYPWCSVSEGRLRSVSPLPLKSQDSDEDIIAGFLRETAGVGWREDLWEKAKSASIGKPHFDRILSFSTIIVRHGERLYGLIGTAAPVLGADVAVDTQEESVSPVHVGAAENTCQIPPEGVTGLLAGCEPRSRVFPFQVAAAILEKSSDLPKPWSISELQLTASDRMAIREWGKHGAWDMRREMRKAERVGTRIVSGPEAISLTFLAFSSIITREDGVEGEMWPLIKSALGEPLRQALFGRVVVPKVVIRDGTEDVCRRLRIRHVFGREGEQSWLRTVFLQFGFTRRGIAGMDRWMMTREHVPVAVDDLLDHSRGLQSESFASMWQALQELRWRSITALVLLCYKKSRRQQGHLGRERAR